MSSQSNENTSKDSNPLLGPLEQLQNAGFGNMVGMNTAWLEALSDMSAEVAGFVAERIKQDVKTQHEILHCKDVNDIQHIQAQFIQKAIDQYRDETGKLVEMGSKTFKSFEKDSEA
jgi:phage gp36-like protein